MIVENTALGQTFTASDLDRALQGSGATDAAAAWEQVSVASISHKQTQPLSLMQQK